MPSCCKRQKNNDMIQKFSSFQHQEQIEALIKKILGISTLSQLFAVNNNNNNNNDDNNDDDNNNNTNNNNNNTTTAEANNNNNNNNNNNKEFLKLRKINHMLTKE